MPQPAHKPTDETRRQVHALSGYGMRQTEIATIIGITKPTLHKYYRAELDVGMLEADAKVVESLYNNAVKNKNVTAQIFWLKNRRPGEWRDKRDFEHSGETIHKIEIELVEAKREGNGHLEIEMSEDFRITH